MTFFKEYMAKQQANEILESDEKDLVILSYLGTKVFRKTPGNEKLRQWWLTNSEFTEHDLDLISSMADLFGPDIQLDKCRAHMKRYRSNSDAHIDGADSPVTYSGLRDLVKKIRDSAALWESCSEFTEDDLDLILTMANLFQPMDTSQFDHVDRGHINRYCSNSDDQIVGADSPVTYSGLRETWLRRSGVLLHSRNH